MRLDRLGLALLFTGPAAILCCAGPAATPADDREAVASVIERLEAANNTGDVEGWVELFAEDFVYMAPGSPPMTSRTELVEVARAGFRNQASIEIAPAEIQTFDDWAFSRNDVTGTVKLHGSGEEVTVDVKEIVLFKRDGRGSWKIARLIINSNS